MKKMLVYYQARKHKIALFTLDKTSNSFAKYARLVAEETRGAHVWVNNMKKMN